MPVAPASRQRAKATPARSRPGRWRLLWDSGRLAALVLAIVCTGGLIYLLTARALTVQQLVLTGAAAASEQEIADGSGVMGHNIFTVEPQAVAERLAALPTVREARVWNELPDRLVVRIVERQPIMVWQVGGDRFLVDEGGAILAANPPDERLRDLPVIAVRDVDPPQVGQRVDSSAVAAMALVLRRAPEYGLPVGTLTYSPRAGMVLQIDEKRQIILGDGTRLPDKLAASAAIASAEANWVVLNVTDPDRPFFPAR